MDLKNKKYIIQFQNLFTYDCFLSLTHLFAHISITSQIKYTFCYFPPASFKLFLQCVNFKFSKCVHVNVQNRAACECLYLQNTCVTYMRETTMIIFTRRPMNCFAHFREMTSLALVRQFNVRTVGRIQTLANPTQSCFQCYFQS